MSDKAITPARIYPSGTPLPPANPDDESDDRTDWHSLIPKQSAPQAPGAAAAPEAKPATGQKARVLAGVQKVRDHVTKTGDEHQDQTPKNAPKSKKGKKGKKKRGGACDCCGLTACTCQCPIRGEHTHDAASCCDCCTANDGEEHTEETDGRADANEDQADDEDDEKAVTRAWRQAKALKSLASLEGRRRAALLYLPAFALAWGMEWHKRLIAYMEAGHGDPDRLIGAMLALAILAPGLWKAVRSGSAVLGIFTFAFAGVLFEFGGEKATTYMSAHGIDPARFTPVGVALLTLCATWWFIDRRTAHWWPPIACALRTPTAAVAVALCFYAAP